MSKKVMSAEIREDGKKVEVYFRFDFALLDVVSKISGSEMISQDKLVKRKRTDDVPHWEIPLDVQAVRDLRAGANRLEYELRIGPELLKWGRTTVRHATRLRSLSQGTSAALERLPQELPHLALALFCGPLSKGKSEEELVEMADQLRAGTFDLSYLSHLTPEQVVALREQMKNGSYQGADVSFSAHAANAANFNVPGTGKTLELIGATFERGFPDDGIALVSAPKTSLPLVWEPELLFWQDRLVLVAPEGRSAREAAIREAKVLYQNGESFWFVVNPAMLVGRFENVNGKDVFVPPYPWLHEVEWDEFIIDEFHMCGLGNTSTVSNKSMNKVKAKHRQASSGTPIGGKATKLFPVLKFCNPDDPTFSNRTRWENQWLTVEIEERYFGKNEKRAIRNVSGIRPDREESFYEHLSQYAVRRTKEEALPWLPPKDRIHLFSDLEGGDFEDQRKQYKEFALNAEITIEDNNLSAIGILAEYTRLKQFSNAPQKVRMNPKEPGKFLLTPIIEKSCKLPIVLQILEELGIYKADAVSEEQVVIFSQFSSIVDALAAHLESLGVKTEKITGDVTNVERTRIAQAFQRGDGPKVLCMTTTAGGVAITLDKASTVIFMDETWNPDDQTQAEDRVHRASRIHQVTIYYIRTKKTIEEYVYEVTQDKEEVNFNILDQRRLGLRATAT